MLDVIRAAWGWTGLDPAEMVAENALGNVIVRSADGVHWRVCPEELTCAKVANDSAGFVALTSSDDFRTDWEMAWVVDLARLMLGPLPEGWCYCLKIPGVLGGRYELNNLGTIRKEELIAFAGDLAKQIKDLPDGAQIKLALTP